MAVTSPRSPVDGSSFLFRAVTRFCVTRGGGAFLLGGTADRRHVASCSPGLHGGDDDDAAVFCGDGRAGAMYVTLRAIGLAPGAFNNALTKYVLLT